MTVMTGTNSTLVLVGDGFSKGGEVAVGTGTAVRGA
jgi:hypothetical protein